jgi:ssDNA-binding Zn-finger/Zn-ribbon topoisomerase 1
MATDKKVNCPICGLNAIYKYGKTKSGKQRFQCIMCGRQFSQDAKKYEVKGKPICSQCGKLMHLYKIEGEIIRFRCSGYPECKAFRKFKIKEIKEKEEL